MIDLNQEIDITAFFQWWGKELQILLPKKLRDVLSQGKNSLIIEINQEQAHLKFVTAGEDHDLGDFPVNALTKEEIINLKRSQPSYQDAQIVLRLPENQAVVQDIFLPVAVDSNLEQVINYELDRYTPFPKDDIYYDIIKKNNAKNHSHLHIQLILVKKEDLDHAYQQCLTIGLQPMLADTAQLPVQTNDKQSHYNLLDKSLCQKENKKPLIILLCSCILAFMTFMVLLYYPIHTASEQLNELKEYSTKAERKARDIDNSKKAIDYLYLATESLITKKNSSPAMIAIIDTLSQILPDNTYVSRFHYHRKNLQLTGQSGSASNLIESLEKTRLFKNVKFISSVTKDKKSGLERYKLSAKVIKPSQNANTE